jgi:hypothetical protein
MVIIRNISHDIQEKVKEADRDIRKAIELKHEYSDLANNYYEFSVERMKEALELHEEVVKIIDDYKSSGKTTPTVMQEMWDFQHRVILEDTENVKVLQEYYKKL